MSHIRNITTGPMASSFTALRAPAASDFHNTKKSLNEVNEP